MRIAINTRITLMHNTSVYKAYMYNVLQSLILNHSTHEFLIVVDFPSSKTLFQANNVTQQIIGSKTKIGVAAKYWYDIQLAKAIKKFNADVVLHFDCRTIATIKTPQIIIVHNFSFIHNTTFLSHSEKIFFKLYEKKWLQKASTIVTLSQYTQQQIAKSFTVEINKIHTIPIAARNIFTELNQENKEATKLVFAAGNEYFLYIGSTHIESNLIQLLKGFSLFKKRLQSSMKLLVIAASTNDDVAIKEKLATYKYKEDVLLLQDISEIDVAKITASAYALIDASLKKDYCITVIEAIQCCIPVACSNIGCLPETVEDAALLFNPFDEKNIAEQLMLLYKDENLRNDLIEKGRKISSKISFENTVQSFYKTIEQTVNR